MSIGISTIFIDIIHKDLTEIHFQGPPRPGYSPGPGHPAVGPPMSGGMPPRMGMPHAQGMSPHPYAGMSIVPSGVYFIHMEGPTYCQPNKLLLEIRLQIGKGLI